MNSRLEVRNNLILKLRESGAPYSEIGLRFNITRQAVHLIIKKNGGMLKITPSVREVYLELKGKLTSYRVGTLMNRYRRFVKRAFSLSEIIDFIETNETIYCTRCHVIQRKASNAKYCSSCSSEAKKYRNWSKERKRRFSEAQKRYREKKLRKGKENEIWKNSTISGPVPGVVRI